MKSCDHPATAPQANCSSEGKGHAAMACRAQHEGRTWESPGQLIEDLAVGTMLWSILANTHASRHFSLLRSDFLVLSQGPRFLCRPLFCG